AWLKVRQVGGDEGVVEPGVECHELGLHDWGGGRMRLESIGLRHIQAGSGFVDGWIETMYRLHEHFEIGWTASSTQGSCCGLWLVAGTVVDLSEALQHREIK